MRLTYSLETTKARIGWTASVTAAPVVEEGRSRPVIGLQGPVYWRPTRVWVHRRADRHVMRRMRAEERAAAASTTHVYDKESA